MSVTSAERPFSPAGFLALRSWKSLARRRQPGQAPARRPPSPGLRTMRRAHGSTNAQRTHLIPASEAWPDGGTNSRVGMTRLAVIANVRVFARAGGQADHLRRHADRNRRENMLLLQAISFGPAKQGAEACIISIHMLHFAALKCNRRVGIGAADPNSPLRIDGCRIPWTSVKLEPASSFRFGSNSLNLSDFRPLLLPSSVDRPRSHASSLYRPRDAKCRTQQGAIFHSDRRKKQILRQALKPIRSFTA